MISYDKGVLQRNPVVRISCPCIVKCIAEALLVSALWRKKCVNLDMRRYQDFLAKYFCFSILIILHHAHPLYKNLWTKAYVCIQLLRYFFNGHSLAKRARVTKGYLSEKFSRTWKLVVDLVKILFLLDLITLVLYHREYFTVFRLCMYLEMYFLL